MAIFDNPTKMFLWKFEYKNNKYKGKEKNMLLIYMSWHWIYVDSYIYFGISYISLHKETYS